VAEDSFITPDGKGKDLDKGMLRQLQQLW